VDSSLLLITVIALVGAAAGVSLTSIHAFSKKSVPFSGGVLVGIALFWVLPEMSETLGWFRASLWTAAGFALIGLIDRFVYPVCPSCSHTHEHDHCETRLHGFAPPMIIAATLHSLMDGWMVSAAGSTTTFGAAFLIGMVFHKLPEGIALGAIVRASVRSRTTALLLCLIAEGATLVGGRFESMFASQMDRQVLSALLAIAGGSFLYLGGHAIHGELRKSGTAFVPALTGVAGSSVLRFFVR
jgi:zinc and cadmium transporter